MSLSIIVGFYSGGAGNGKDNGNDDDSDDDGTSMGNDDSGDTRDKYRAPEDIVEAVFVEIPVLVDKNQLVA